MSTQPRVSASSIAGVAVSGIIMGAAMSKAGVTSPALIRAQMTFSDLTMLKMFMSAAAGACFSQQLARWWSKTREAAIANARAYTDAPLGLPATLLGTAMVGAGMSLSGSCPGTVFAQLGEGQSSTAVLTLFGGLIGSAAFGIFSRVSGRFLTAGPALRSKLNDVLGCPEWVARLGLGAVFLAVAFTADSIMPSGLPLLPAAATSPRWSPITAGLLLGSLQLPLLWCVRKTIGCASSYATAVAQVLTVSTPFFDVKRAGWVNAWQVVFVSSMVVGAFFAASTSSPRLSPEAPAVSPTLAVLGGAVFTFGANMAGGCTSGHGISGSSHLAMRSLAGVCAMFGAGIAVASVLKTVGVA